VAQEHSIAPYDPQNKTHFQKESLSLTISCFLLSTIPTFYFPPWLIGISQIPQLIIPARLASFNFQLILPILPVSKIFLPLQNSSGCWKPENMATLNLTKGQTHCTNWDLSVLHIRPTYLMVEWTRKPFLAGLFCSDVPIDTGHLGMSKDSGQIICLGVICSFA
jgi:hypothetical protein